MYLTLNSQFQTLATNIFTRSSPFQNCNWSKGHFEAAQIVNDGAWRNTGLTTNEIHQKMEQLNAYMQKTLYSPMWWVLIMLLFTGQFLFADVIYPAGQEEEGAEGHAWQGNTLIWLPFIVLIVVIVFCTYADISTQTKVAKYVSNECFEDWKQRNIIVSACFFRGSRYRRACMVITLNGQQLQQQQGQAQVIQINAVQQRQGGQEPMAPMIYAPTTTQPIVVQPIVVQPMQQGQAIAVQPTTVQVQGGHYGGHYQQQQGQGGGPVPVPIATARVM